MEGEDEEEQGGGAVAAIILPPFVAAIDVPLQNDAAAAMALTLPTAAAKHGSGVCSGRRTWRMGGASSSGWQASARQCGRGGECGDGGCERGRGDGGSGEAGRGREGDNGEADVAEARGDPGIILCLSCFCSGGGRRGRD
jgi:hypothetical protein